MFRLWLPCIDSYNELCTWNIEVAVDPMMTAIAPGELIEANLSVDGKEKTFYYELNVPTSACNIALAVGYVCSNGGHPPPSPPPLVVI